MKKIVFVLLAGGLIVACSKKGKDALADNQIQFELVKAFPPNDVTAFTQRPRNWKWKTFWKYRSKGTSWIAEVDLVTGKQNKKVTLDNNYFGEGITFLNNKVYQLTWQNHEGFVYDARTLKS